jgi:hypothetical protein
MLAVVTLGILETHRQNAMGASAAGVEYADGIDSRATREAAGSEVFTEGMAFSEAGFASWIVQQGDSLMT